MKGKVYLVGAGPGDPGLITVKGVECLKKADVVVYDHLLDDQLLGLAPAEAEKIYVGKSGSEHSREQDEINRLLVSRAKEGKAVVRLKGGDPFVLGRGGEEAEVLARNGFRYDSSIFPFKTRLYGVSKAPLHPYKPSFVDISREDTNGSILEFPMTVIKLGMNVPISGGFYFRALPLWFLKLAIRRINRTRPVVIYIHPWETYPKTPRLRNLPLASRFVTYYGMGSALKKFGALLGEFQFQPMCETLARITGEDGHDS